MDKHKYEKLNNYVMGVIYSPLLIFTAAYEAHEAQKVRFNRSRGEADDDTVEEWEEMNDEIDFEGEGWDKKVQSAKPDVEFDVDVVEIRELKVQVAELKELIQALKPDLVPEASAS
jgi:hypothetical protein